MTVSAGTVEREFDYDELRARLVEETEEAFRLADDLATEVAAGASSPKQSELASLYLRTRGLIRTLRRQLVMEIAG